MRAAVVAAVGGTTGFAVMSLELAAVRLLAPYFGDSAYVWTNVIGVMLVALAVGAMLGGRLADPAHVQRRVAILLVASGALVALIPLVARPLGEWLLPDDLPLDSAMGALVRGSLAATLLVFAPPVLLAGTVTPMLVASLAAAGSRVGRASGLVAASSTLGSLAGTFATTHLMVPGFGSRATIWCCAALLVASGLVCRPARSAAVVLLSVIGVALVPLGPMHAPSADATVLREVESSYQFLQVVRRTPPGEPATTMLRINEGLDSFHSVLVEGSEFTGGRYYDYHAVVPYLVGDGARPAFLRILSLGAAAGTFERVFAAAHQGTVVDSVEIDPGVVALGREFFGAFVTPGRVFSGLDARVFVEHCDERYHAVLVDAYERQIYIPAHVASRQFFAAVAECLLPGGIVAVNAGGRTFDDPVVRALSGTIAAVYGAAHAFRIPESRNFMILGRKGRVLDPAVLQDVTDAGPDMGRVLAAASRSGAWRTFAPGNEALDDDRPFLDVLQERALVRRIADPAIVPIGGTRPSEEVEQEVYGLASERDWEGVLRSVSSAAAATGYLRMMAGDARWRLHDQVGAAAEYDAALAIGADDSLLPELERRVGLVLAAREQGERAERITARNGLLAIGAALVLAVLAAAVHRLGRAPSRAPRPAEVA